jgi:hypothetical protein
VRLVELELELWLRGVDRNRHCRVGEHEHIGEHRDDIEGVAAGNRL